VLSADLSVIQFQYCTSVTKYDRHGYKPRERILTLSSQALYLHDAKDMKQKHKILLNDLSGMTITNMGDNLLLIRIPAEQKQMKVIMSNQL
jgi:myosin-1